MDAGPVDPPFLFQRWLGSFGLPFPAFQLSLKLRQKSPRTCALFVYGNLCPCVVRQAGVCGLSDPISYSDDRSVPPVPCPGARPPSAIS